MRQEDTILFPLIVRLESSGMSAFGRVEAHVRTMVEDHDTVVGLLRTLRSLTNDYAIPSRVSVEYGELLSGLASLDADLREHLRLEQEVLLPRLMALEV